MRQVGAHKNHTMNSEAKLAVVEEALAQRDVASDVKTVLAEVEKGLRQQAAAEAMESARRAAILACIESEAEAYKECITRLRSMNVDTVRLGFFYESGMVDAADLKAAVDKLEGAPKVFRTNMQLCCMFLNTALGRHIFP